MHAEPANHDPSTVHLITGERSNRASDGQRHVFATMDGLRGVAALAVAFYHMKALFAPIYPASAFLAVDLFFCLSGFVIAHAYGTKLDHGMALGRFAWLRIVRLYPLYALALAIQAGMLLLSALIGRGSLSAGLRMILPAITMLPNPWDRRLYPVNEPAWSLFFELAVNFVAALWWRRLSMKVLIGLVVTGAIGLIAVAVATGTIDGGDMWRGFPLGLFRVWFSFFAGVLLYRCRGQITVPALPPYLLTMTLVGVLFLASAVGVAGELFAVLVIFPVLVALASTTEPKKPTAMLALGRLSYAVYVLHIPLLSVALNLLVRLPVNPHPPLSGIIVVGGVVAVSWAADRWFDRPARRVLSAKRAPA